MSEDIVTTDISGTTKVEVGSRANYGVVTLTPGGPRFVWVIASGQSGDSATVARAIAACVAAIRAH